MIDILREHELNLALEAFHFAFRTLVEGPDETLRREGLGRAHHRVLYFLARRPGLGVGPLAARLRVSRQALHAPLRRLIAGGWVETGRDDEDGRTRALRLTRKGAALEARISGVQRRQLDTVFRKVGPAAEKGWSAVMAGVMGGPSRQPLGGF